MPRRSILSAVEREGLLALPDTQEELIRLYTLSDIDLSIIGQHRKPANRLGFAVQLCYMRHPGLILEIDEEPFAPLLGMVAAQLKVAPDCWAEYGQRAETRREHLLEPQSIFGFQTFTTRHYRASIQSLQEPALQTDKGIVLTSELIDGPRRKSILLPSPNVIERICAEAVTRANRCIYAALTDSLSARPPPAPGRTAQA